MSEQSAVIHRDPQILGGIPVFVGTRVPLRNLIDYLERGHSLEEFLDAFPSVSHQQAIAALEDLLPLLPRLLETIPTSEPGQAVRIEP
jgi:uncharacterized protein (DUF433 family)